MQAVQRVYVEKREGFDVAARALQKEFSELLGIQGIKQVRLINRYDIQGLSDELLERVIPTVFSEPQVDTVSRELPKVDEHTRLFAVEYLPGQFDQRAESASECVQLISQEARPLVRSASVYVLEGEISDSDVAAIQNYVINPVEARLASLELPETLELEFPEPADIEVLTGFIELEKAELASLREELGLAMDEADIEFCQNYFREEGRDPSLTEIRMIDTYWSDHCRHTTFGTVLEHLQFDEPKYAETFERYLKLRHELGREDRPVTLMDIATIGAKWLAHTGQLKGLDESEEINACTVRVKIDVDGQEEDWLYLFKNETHNHPTEIEPFGGAATCIGGAIRDPLSGRAYVYQAMRITGAADPTRPLSETLPNKLPQRKLVTTAAEGYSSYGNQIGLATGEVHEIYHPSYVAKRLEIGAVVGATPERNVRRETPEPGDVIVLLGGRTGRDGIGGATGSSKAHKAESLTSCGAEVQKGNAPVERKLQRLFRRAEAVRLIKRCNDFGAGGVAVAIGEIADGLNINLDAVPKKYEGLDGTELAISESQERMAVALTSKDVDAFIAYAREENLEATPVAVVSAEPRLKMQWRGKTIVDISREFLASSGAMRETSARVAKPEAYRVSWQGESLKEKLSSLVSDLNIASQKGLSERFDSTIGAATVLMPFGGKHQLTSPMAMVAKLPVDGETSSCSGMAWGYNPYLMEKDCYLGAYLAVVESVSKLVAAGFKHEDAYLTFQEYFERMGEQPLRWGKPVAALLGALDAQLDLGIAAIGGKDSMSGSFEDLDVVPTLVSFATAIGKLDAVQSPEFKRAGDSLITLVPAYEEDQIKPEAESLLSAYSYLEKLIDAGLVASVATPSYGGVAEQLFKMSLGNRLGVELQEAFELDALFTPAYGSFLVELKDGAELPEAPENITLAYLGRVLQSYEFVACGERVELEEIQELWERPLESVFPYRSKGKATKLVNYKEKNATFKASPVAKPRVIIPVFPGTNCEYDSERAFRAAGAEPESLIINNLSPESVSQSTEALVRAIDESQIVMLPGGFSGGDEPDGSAKFIASFFRSPAVSDAVRRLLNERDGLMLGICNGFQALIKLGLVPFGDIVDMNENCPTLTFNNIGRHQSMLVRTRVASTLSPWFAKCELGDIHTIAISHGEGRFVASEELLAELEQKGQIATQYVSLSGEATSDLQVNPNGSLLNIEGITSPDGRVLGKMGHSERRGKGLYKNICENSYQELFEGGVAYFA